MPIPSYKAVPDTWKHPFGPYRQAPAEYGGRWYYVYPFNQEPWLTIRPEPTTYPPGFIDTFGERPQGKDFPKFGVQLQEAKIRWEQDLELYEGPHRDPRVTEQEWENARKQFLAYGLGEPMPWKNKYGYWIRFPQSLIPWYEIDGISPQVDVGHEIARYQITILGHGEVVENPHFFVPTDFFLDPQED